MDARMRPTGTHGPLVVTRKSWLEHYVAQADIWEIQALLRIRHIAGDRSSADGLKIRHGKSATGEDLRNRYGSGLATCATGWKRNAPQNRKRKST